MAAEGLGESNSGKISLPETLSTREKALGLLWSYRGHSGNVAGGAGSRPS